MNMFRHHFDLFDLEFCLFCDREKDLFHLLNEFIGNKTGIAVFGDPDDMKKLFSRICI